MTLDGEDLPGAAESDLGSGASPGNGEPALPRPRGRVRLAPPLAFTPMTESQRRFLFRLLAAQGLQQEAAHERLLDLLGVESLSAVSKEMASSLIDELQGESRPRGESPSASRGAPLQR